MSVAFAFNEITSEGNPVALMLGEVKAVAEAAASDRSGLRLSAVSKAKMVAETVREWPSFLKRYFNAHRAEPEFFLQVAELDDGRPAGFVCTAAVNPAADGPCLPPDCGKLAMLYVSPELWGNGLGQAMFAAAVDRLKAAGRKSMILWTDRDDAYNAHFYEKMGGQRREDNTDYGCGLDRVMYVWPSI